MEQKKGTRDADERSSGITTALFSVTVIFTAVFVCVLVILLTIRGKAPTPPSSETSPLESELPETTPPEGPSVPVFSPSNGALSIKETEATKELTSELSSQYGILVDAQTGEMIAGKDAHTRFNPASMTKIMTLIVACERLTEADLEKDVTFTEEIVSYVRPNSGGYYQSHCYWNDAGDGGSIRTQLYGIGVESAADCSMMVVCYLVGKSPAESEAQFVQWMNEKATELGLRNTHFDNVIGHESEENYSTVADIAAILIRALECPLIREILSAETWVSTGFGYNSSGKFNPSFRTTFYSTLFNANPERSSREQAYEEKYGAFKLNSGTLNGGKTGSLEHPKKTWHYSLASFATVNGKTYVVITGETTVAAEVLRDAKTLYDSYIE